MSYGILLWGHAADTEIIFVLQKMAIRAIYNLKPKESLRQIFKKINILILAFQYIYENVMYVHKNKSSFTNISDIHSVNTRNRHKLIVPVTLLHRVSNSFLGRVIRFYKKIPENIQNLTCSKFKNFIKLSLYKKGYYKVKEFMDDNNPWE
ncbi:unnamed protein product [Parnassius mnemosyne]|uniref:Uncharacterized protein n=1 Tax=Parnassius mnemosyne TaxID=213953 RepID=A0AAV1KPF2_9NEOP